MRTLVVLASIAVLAGCAAPEPAPRMAAADGAPVATAQKRPLTGSRLSRSTMDRSLRTIGQQELDSEHPITSLGNEVGPRNN
ncbi:hypothetical protein IP92_00415 [Pseudoduganella flava]|uniref:Lipoprotein n=1 Tax=Pseudoduganella flava TaxID=871742 RepID=A0A562Q5H5_9BURK|nr:hypothetical protein [Pseudoduganella flava]QGZ41471.1 hypothetical protein GO485_22010 [Pseudoduganella flava]TWI51430.1 hypothetical protein IP92_00415 [Pseudoduganella flava]